MLSQKDKVCRWGPHGHGQASPNMLWWPQGKHEVGRIFRSISDLQWLKAVFTVFKHPAWRQDNVGQLDLFLLGKQAHFVEREQNKFFFPVLTVPRWHQCPDSQSKTQESQLAGWWFSSSTKVSALYITCYFQIIKRETKRLNICCAFLMWSKLMGSKSSDGHKGGYSNLHLAEFHTVGIIFIWARRRSF